MIIAIDGGKRRISFSGTVRGLLEHLSLSPSSVVVMRKGEIVTLDESLNNDDEVVIMSVLSGG